MAAIASPGTLVERVLALRGCERYGARFVNRSGAATFYPYDAILTRALTAAAAYQTRGIRAGDRIAIILPTSVGFLDAFLGAVLAGAIPAALYPPVRLGRLDEYYARTRDMLGAVGTRLLVTDARTGRLLGRAVEGVSSLDTTLDVGALGSAAAGSWSRPHVDPDAPAFLQFSSGTTVEPKAVMVSHANALANLTMIDTLFRNITDAEAEQGGVCWLPLYHDMGLLGCLLLGLYHPGTITYINPEHFIVQPALWLRTISRFRAICSPAPDFAYGVCASKIRDEELEGVDLSHWRYALNGAEPIDVETMNRFCARFARWGFRPEAMMPVYGLAEAGLAVTFSDPATPPHVEEFDRERLASAGVARPGKGRRLPSVGRPMPGLQIEIRDERDRTLPDGEVGTIMVAGPSITRGYFAHPDLTAKLLRGGWLDTGDLGFIHQGELYITGRKKDLIIIRGRNIAPQEIEALAAGAPGLRTGCIIAGGLMVEGEGEQLIVLAEKDPRSDRRDEELAADIHARILEGIGLEPRAIDVLKPGTLPRTSSGKLRRAAAIQAFAAGELAPPTDPTALRLLGEVARSQLAWARRRFVNRDS
ncbi:MAG TPA: AMP-binding protein [Vicinamibacterales bacterium]